MDMRPMVTPSNKHGSEEWTHKYLTANVTQPQGGPLAWWYRLTAPPPPSPTASFAKRELVRRGRLASTIIFCLILVLIGVLPIGIFGPNHFIVVTIGIMLILIVIALTLNRRGRSNATGLIVSLGTNLALFAVIRLSSGGLSASSLGLFDLLVFSELFVASLLPVNWIFIAALINIAFIVIDLSTQQRTASFAITMAADAYPIIVRPVALHIIVSLVLWLWVRSATQAIARADRAEVIAKLEHTLAEQEHVVAEQKRQLDVSIRQIVETHMRVANGDFGARVPLTNDNVLWQIAGSLNNLLARIQRLRQFEQEMRSVLPQFLRLRQDGQELKRLKETIALLTMTIRKARLEHHPIQLARSGTPLDLLITEINSLNQPAQPPGRPGKRPLILKEPGRSGPVSY